MERATAGSSRRTTSDTTVCLGKSIIRLEADVLQQLADRLDSRFAQAVSAILACAGHVVVTGLGKAGLIGQKISATLASLGTPSYFMHPTEAVHGDLGRLRTEDLVLALSLSGETEEVLRLAGHLVRLSIPMVSITGREGSRLAGLATINLHLGEVREAGSLELAPTASTTAMLALGDALALAVSEERGFSAADFAHVHPGGSLGLELSKVEDVMRPLQRCRIAAATTLAREVLVSAGGEGRRSGAVMLVDESGKLSGIFTDSDLVRLFEQRRESALDEPIEHVMTRSPKIVQAGQAFRDALILMKSEKISELPVVDPEGRPLGLVDITDVVSLWPAEVKRARPDARPPSTRRATIPFSRPSRNGRRQT